MTRGRKYTFSHGGRLFRPPPLCSLRKWPFLVQKMIKPSSPKLYVFKDLKEGLEPMRPPQPPKKPTFWKYWKSSWKLVIFKKVGFLGGQRGGSWFLTLQNDFIYHCLLIFFIWGSKKPFYPKNQYLKIGIFKLFGGLGGSPSEIFFLQKWLQTINHN